VATYEVDSDTAIPDLIRRLADDSKRLAGDEVRLAKLELNENVRNGLGGLVRLALAAGFAIVAVVALTVVLVALISRMLGNHYWAGALIVGLVEALLGVLFLRHGTSAMKSRSYSLQNARESLKDTVSWVRNPTGR